MKLSTSLRLAGIYIFVGALCGANAYILSGKMSALD